MIISTEASHSILDFKSRYCSCSTQMLLQGDLIISNNYKKTKIGSTYEVPVKYQESKYFTHLNNDVEHHLRAYSLLST